MSSALPSKFVSHFLQLDIEYDKFIRTTDCKHEAVVNEFYSRVLNNGDIYRADYEGLYCVSCEEYKVSFHVNFLTSY
jgi:methionyl-tRNA synthetase